MAPIEVVLQVVDAILTYNRPDFWTTTSNKQLNFVQLVQMATLERALLDAIHRPRYSGMEDRDFNEVELREAAGYAGIGFRLPAGPG